MQKQLWWHRINYWIIANNYCNAIIIYLFIYKNFAKAVSADRGAIREINWRPLCLQGLRLAGIHSNNLNRFAQSIFFQWTPLENFWNWCKRSTVANGAIYWNRCAKYKSRISNHEKTNHQHLAFPISESYGCILVCYFIHCYFAEEYAWQYSKSF